MSKIEILAPVGNEEMLKAAVFSGADAIYLGFSGFNARSSAGNFTADSLAQAVSFCHGRGVAVYVAMNTTVYAAELGELTDAIYAVAASGADAIICQDLAVARLARQIAPALPLHGSTQMSVHTLAGAKQLAAMGFSRAILARELSFAEIEHITKRCGIETEAFVHGALCMCISGQCYMSAFLGGRSGNRGSCAGPCRLPFDASEIEDGMFGRARHLSLKDNSVIDQLARLQEIGVSCAKIEGRLKTPEYVAASVNACLAAREGGSYDKALLEKAFSRSGFTSGYLDGKIDGSMFGVRSDEDGAETRKALPMLRDLYRRERASVPVDIRLEVEEFGAKLSVQDAAGNKAIVYGSAEPEPAKNDPTEGLKRSLAKTGGTPFVAQEITVQMEDGLWYLPASAVNEMRREALATLLQKREAVRPWATTPDAIAPTLALHDAPETKPLRASFTAWAQVPTAQIDALEYLILPLTEARHVPKEYRAKTILSLPRAMFGAIEASVTAGVSKTKKEGFAGYEINNIAHIALAEGAPMFGGFGLNVTNPLAAQYYADLGLRSVLILPEVKDTEMKYISPKTAGEAVPTGIISYGHMPVMLTRACPMHNVTDCEHCDAKGDLTDRKARKFPVRCGGGVRSIYNPVPIYMGDKPNAVSVDYTLALFTIEAQSEAAHWLDLLRSHAPCEVEFTRGLYFKGTN
ncbi:MAG: DUF3656 domain-containing protein [Faecalibacterium sp.]